MGTRPDYYLILGVSFSATDDEIRHAFRHRALELHPDLNPTQDAAVRFQELRTAYDVLGNPFKRAAYNRRAGVRSPSAYRPPAYSANPAPDARPARSRAGLFLISTMTVVGIASVSICLVSVLLASILSKSGIDIFPVLAQGFATIGEAGFTIACVSGLMIVLSTYIWVRGGQQRT